MRSIDDVCVVVATTDGGKSSIACSSEVVEKGVIIDVAIIRVAIVVNISQFFNCNDNSHGYQKGPFAGPFILPYLILSI